MEMLSRLLHIWEVAAKNLGLEIIAPCLLTLPSGENVNAAVLVKNFGAPNGMLIVQSYDEVERCLDELAGAGYGFSVLDEYREDEQYSRQDFIEVLKDWGWNGDERSKPRWL